MLSRATRDKLARMEPAELVAYNRGAFQPCEVAFIEEDARREIAFLDGNPCYSAEERLERILWEMHRSYFALAWCEAEKMPRA